MLSHCSYCVFLPAKKILLNFISIVKKAKCENNLVVNVYLALACVNEQIHPIIFMIPITHDTVLTTFLMGLFCLIILLMGKHRRLPCRTQESNILCLNPSSTNV